ncbi:PLP-dependent aspartate aminotransferase family protein [Glycomyces albus]
MVFPIFQGTVFEAEPGEDVGYLRYANTPTQAYLHGKLAALEGAEAAVATASGMSAIAAVLHTVLAAGDHVIVAGSVYGGTKVLLTEQAERLGWRVTFASADDRAEWAAALRPETKAVYAESITNPLIRVGDLASLAGFAREQSLTSIIDNTFCTPVVFRPHEIGFDLVCHSATKALNGHADVSAGVVTGSADLIGRVRRMTTLYGPCLDPHAAYLLARGVKTLGVRVRQQNSNAQALAEFLDGHERIAEVAYPGLVGHPDHKRAEAWFDGFGSMLAFRPVGGPEAAEMLIKRLRLPYAAPSLGGVESLIARPAAGTRANPEDRAPDGVPDDLVRFSAGIEDTEDLLADFAQALEG